MLNTIKKELKEYLDKRVSNIMSNTHDDSIFNSVVARVARAEERRIVEASARERYNDIANMLSDTY